MTVDKSISLHKPVISIRYSSKSDYYINEVRYSAYQFVSMTRTPTLILFMHPEHSAVAFLLYQWNRTNVCVSFISPFRDAIEIFL